MNQFEPLHPRGSSNEGPRLSEELVRKLEATMEYFSLRLQQACPKLGERLVALGETALTPAEFQEELWCVRPGNDSILATQLARIDGLVKSIGLISSILQLQKEPPPGSPLMALRGIAQRISSLRDAAQNHDLGTIGSVHPVNQFESVNFSLAALFEQHADEFEAIAPSTRTPRRG